MEQNNLDRRDPQNDEDDYIDDTLPVPVKVLGWAPAAFALEIVPRDVVSVGGEYPL